MKLTLHNKNYSSKILLFGEHLINLGCSALTLPFNRYSGSLVHSTVQEEELDYFLKFLKESNFDFLNNTLLGELPSLKFESSIPIGCGCGSSGALVSAMYEVLRIDDLNKPNILKIRLSQMEAFFHGKSSGTDPLVIYLNKAIKFEAGGDIQIISDFKPALSSCSFHLLDTGIQRDGKHFIQLFMDQIADPVYRSKIFDELVPNTENSISSLLSNDQASLINSFKAISEFQYHSMAYLIPDSIKDFWKAGMQSNQYYTKICGAGGGGFFICLSLSNEAPISKYKFLPLFQSSDSI